ncbi:MAG: glycine cleavage system protein GcvH [Phycisphaerales bacterium]
MSSTPSDCKYSESHEWHKLEGDIVTIGITQFAVDELTDITYVELKSVGDSLDAGDTIGEVESVKATSDIYSAIGGEIVEVNEALSDDPSLINSDPYTKGWLVKIRVGDTSPLDSLLDKAAYDSKYAS